MLTRSLFALLAAMLLHVRGAAGADEAFFLVALGELKLTDGALPDWQPRPDVDTWRFRSHGVALLPGVSLEGAGEAYFESTRNDGALPSETALKTASLVIRVPEARDVKGKLFVPTADWSGGTTLSFSIPASQASPEARTDFYRAKHRRYEDLASQSIPGAAWFRHQADAARRELEAIGKPEGGNGQNSWWRRPRASELEETYSVFTGGRALSENLQLDRLLPPVKDGDLTVEVSSLAGITVAALDWKPLIKDSKPAIDPLASMVPADQHALFFPSFKAMIDLLDEADAHGTPVLQLLEPRAEDSRTRERYEKQLCLGMSDLGRLLGPAVVASVAFTGSDPYLRVGSDVAVMFEARAPDVLKGFVEAKHAAALKADAAARKTQGDVDGVAYSAVVSPDRSVSSYVAAQGSTIIVSNSLAQIGRLVETSGKKTPAIASTDEYVFFRNRYPRGDQDESAFLILTDATIRRWCGPVWRIGDSRRTRMAAVLAELEAQHVEELAKGTVKEGPLETSLGVPGSSGLRMTKSGPVSDAYGSLEFMTPITELSITRVTATEAQVYTRFRESYQQNWRRFFDPIAVRFTAKPERIALDVTVMPLIEGTEYREIIDVTRGAEIAPTSGDPHRDALLHVAVAINTQSRTLSEFGRFASGMVPGLKADPLAWLGGSVAIYVDQDSIWEEIQKKKDELARHPERHIGRLPIALRCEVKDAFGLAGFLAVVRGFIEQSAPGLTAWETRTYKDRPYVKVSPSERAKSDGEVPQEAQDVAVYYAAGGGALVISPREDVLQRALDRQIERKAAAEKKASPDSAWLGTSIAARADRKAADIIDTLVRDDYRAEVQNKAWGNLPILNEWRRLFPGSDPVKLHEKLWGARLLCPGGGTYVWNEEWHTMESTVYGHPARPKAGPELALPISTLSAASFGLTFEPNGVRARAEIERKTAKP